MTTASSLLKAIAGYTSESALRLFLVAVVGLFVARYLGPELLGLLGFATSTFALLMPLSTLGMRSVLVKEFSGEDPWQPALIAALSRQLPVALLVSLAGWAIVASSRGFEDDAVLIGLVLSPLPLLATGDSVRALLESQGRVRRIVTAGVVATLVASLLKVTAIVVAAPVWVFAVAQTVEVGLLTTGLIIAMPGSLRLGSARSLYNPELAKRLTRESMPLLVSAVAVGLYMRADVMMVNLLSGDQQTGIYVAASRLSEVWYFIPVSAAAAIRPRLSGYFSAGDLPAYKLMTQRFITSAFAVSCAAAVVVLLLADQLVTFLYGADFAAAAGVLRVHVLAAPFVFIGVASSQWFVDQNKTRAVVVRSAAGAIINIALNFVLIPLFGAIGAAMATLVAYAASGVLINGLTKDTRPLFVMQLRSALLTWR
jgi:PST family polysaccharide transporter